MFEFGGFFLREKRQKFMLNLSINVRAKLTCFIPGI